MPLKNKCPKGTRKNKHFNKCMPYVKCPENTKKNNKTWDCEPIFNSSISFDKYTAITKKNEKSEKGEKGEKSEKSEKHKINKLLYEYAGLKKLYPQISYITQGITLQQKKILDNYTGMAYNLINKNLRNVKFTSKTISEYVKTIDKIFEEIPPITSSLKVYRGFSYPSLDVNVIPETLKNVQYLSTSLTYVVALRFATEVSNIEDIDEKKPFHLYEIHIPKNSKILPLFFNSNYLNMECEILLDRRGTLKKISATPTRKTTTVVFEYIPPDYTNSTMMKEHKISSYKSSIKSPVKAQPSIFQQFLNLVYPF